VKTAPRATGNYPTLKDNSMDQSDLPPIPKDLMEALDKRFPEKSPSLKTSIDEIRFESGKRAVVRFLLDQYNLQNEKVIKTQVLK
jgi:hypothetical protein